MVLDASVIIKWTKKESESKIEEALDYYEKLHKNEIEIIVPDLIFYELANISSRQTGAGLGIFIELINNIFCSNIKIVFPDEELIKNTIKIAKDFKVTAYDATYLACASRFQTKMVTADSKLCAKVPELTIPL